MSADLLTLEAAHTYEGMCPDEETGWQSRDPKCPACRALIELSSLRDALAALTRERDSLRAELRGAHTLFAHLCRDATARNWLERAEALLTGAAPTPAADAEAPVWECKAGGLKPLTQAQYEAQPARIQRHYTRIAHTREAICAALLVGLPLSAEQRASLLVMLRTAGDAEALREALRDARRYRWLRDKNSHHVHATAWLNGVSAVKDTGCDIFSADEVPALLNAEVDRRMARAALAADAGRAKTEGGE